MNPTVAAVLSVAATTAAAVAVAVVIEVLVRRLRRRIGALARLVRVRGPFRVFVAAAAMAWAIHAFGPAGGWHLEAHLSELAVIGCGAWLICAAIFVVEDAAMPRLRIDVPDNRHVRAVRTQLMVVRRVTAAAVTVIAIGAALLTFQSVRLVGTSLIASAGVAAAIAAFATNTLLSNVVAGLQIAFGGALRLDDVVVVCGDWGRVVEITLTYVVVRTWDDRRLILPTSYFTSQPFENWTHTTANLIGAVVLDADWTVDVAALRDRLTEVLAETPLWDKRVATVQVVDAVGGSIQVRALVSAADAPTLWDLRCLVREQLVAHLCATGAPPRTRADVLRTPVQRVNGTGDHTASTDAHSRPTRP